MVVWLAKMFKSFVYIFGLKTATERSHIEKIKEYTYQVRSFLINNQISCEVVFRHADSLSKEILLFSAEKNADFACRDSVSRRLRDPRICFRNHLRARSGSASQLQF